MLNELLTVVLEHQNEELNRILNNQEVQQAVLGLNRTSIGGSDGMTGAFLKDTWGSIGKDIHNMVISFFCGFELPKFITRQI